LYENPDAIPGKEGEHSHKHYKGGQGSIPQDGKGPVGEILELGHFHKLTEECGHNPSHEGGNGFVPDSDYQHHHEREEEQRKKEEL